MHQLYAEVAAVAAAASGARRETSEVLSFCLCAFCGNTERGGFFPSRKDQCVSCLPTGGARCAVPDHLGGSLTRGWQAMCVWLLSIYDIGFTIGTRHDRSCDRPLSRLAVCWYFPSRPGGRAPISKTSRLWGSDRCGGRKYVCVSVYISQLREMTTRLFCACWGPVGWGPPGLYNTNILIARVLVGIVVVFKVVTAAMSDGNVGWAIWE